MATTSTTPKKGLAKVFSLEEQFAFYGAYHSNHVNIAIHILCVPCIFWSALVMGNRYLPSFGHVDIPFLENLGVKGGDVLVNSSLLTAVGYTTYFIILEPLAGILYAPILLTLGLTANAFYASDPSTHFQYAVILHVVCWIAQFVGHGKFEGRAPALLDNLFQSVVLAVFFVWVEVLFGLGYRPQLRKRVNNRIGKEILAFRSGKKEEERRRAAEKAAASS
ncbi:DUF962-domain-containing protein [Atractiella rhizophila]|nr:DUF962-domain-containing protein [Atractiella rhizophila]